MTTLPRNHPFITVAKKLEFLESQYGVTDDIIDARAKLKANYPEYYSEYMRAKSNKQSERKQNEKREKEIQTKERGCETVSYHKKMIEYRKKKNRKELSN